MTDIDNRKVQVGDYVEVETTRNTWRGFVTKRDTYCKIIRLEPAVCMSGKPHRGDLQEYMAGIDLEARSLIIIDKKEMTNDLNKCFMLSLMQ